MGKLQLILKYLWKNICIIIAEYRRERLKNIHPIKFAREYIDSKNLTPLALLDNECIWQKNRTRYDDFKDRYLYKKLFADLFDISIKKTMLPITIITQIQGSKSCGKVGEWKYIKDFGKKVYDRKDLSCRDNIAGLVKHVLREERTISVKHYQWSDEYIWDNLDGSHHFAVAYYHASQGIEVEIPATLNRISFNKNKYNEVTKNGSIWITHCKNYQNCISELRWELRFESEYFEYPLIDSPNMIFTITKDVNGIENLLREYPSYFMPFENLFK